MHRFAFIFVAICCVSAVGCHRGIRPGGIFGHRYHAGCDSCQTGGYEVAQADYVSAADCGCGDGGCNRCNGEHVRFRDSVGQPLVRRIAQGLSCGSGCGEIYWGEWISTPPKPDPCDTCGNYTGVPNSVMYRPHRQPVRNIVRSIAGVRYGSPCEGCGSAVGCDTGCDDCGSTGGSDCGCGSSHSVPVPAVDPTPNSTIPAPQPRADQPIQKTAYLAPAHVHTAGCKTCKH